MKSIFLLSTLFISISIANGQKKEYLDEYLERTTSDYATYYRTCTRDFGQQIIGEAKTYRVIDSTLYSITNHWKGNLNGEYQLYYPNGELKLIGSFTHGIKTGIWRTYYENGNTQSELEYSDNFSFKVVDHFSSSGDTLAYGGNGKYAEYHANGNLKIEGSIKDGLRDAAWLLYNENGVLLHKEIYDLGEFQSGITFLKNKKIEYQEVFKSAEPKGGFFKWYWKLKQESEGSIDGVSANLRISFTVIEDGSITDIRVVHGYNEEVDSRAIELVKKSKKWKPAIQRGIPTSEKRGFSLQF